MYRHCLEKNHRGGTTRHHPSTIALLALALAYSIVILSRVVKLTRLPAPDDESVADLPSTWEAAPERRPAGPMDEADFIIQRSYAETYARMYPCKDEVEKDCIQLVVEHMEAQNAQNEKPPPRMRQNSRFQVPVDHPYPWWFQTLLRDIPDNGAYGFWHHFSTFGTETPIRFCAIGKNGSTEWRRIFRKLNAPEHCRGKEGCEGKFNPKVRPGDDAPFTVFIRDPLERLLSGYLDKCVKNGIRRNQGHCTPNEIFSVDRLEFKNKRLFKGEEKIPIPPDLTLGVKDAERELFAAFVDLHPLKWNVHFVPQASLLQIFSWYNTHVGKYDFVGVMGRDFMSDLDRMANWYGGLLPEALDDAFQYRSKLVNQSANVGLDSKHGTKAPEKVARYYSARAIRRALEYLSIDYVTLSLEVPEWAREMLRDDAV
ncbi:hypothetical protein ACHAWF_013174 [Thalassiosira exigua]